MVLLAAARQQIQDEGDETEDGTKPPRIEIQVSVPLNQRSECLVNYELRAQLETAGAIFNSANVLHMSLSAQAIYEEEILETKLHIRHGQPHNTVLDASIDFAKKWCETVGHGLHEAFRLEFLSRDSYYFQCIPDHLNIPVRSFSLGSFRNVGVFDEHFRAQRHDPRSKPIVIDFEHDYKQMNLFCMYETLAPYSNQPRQYPRGQKIILIDKLSFQYGSIQSIVVDFAGDSGDALLDPSIEHNELAVIYFRLRYPPKIHAAWGRTEVAQRNHNNNVGGNNFERCMDNRRACYYERVRSLVDCEEHRIGKCNVLKLVLSPRDVNLQYQRYVRNRDGDPDMDMAWHSINQILSRLKSRCNCRIFYTGIRTKATNDPDIPISENYLSSFKCFYLLQALISTRPFNIADQVNPTFLNYVRSCACQNERAAEIALSQLLAATDESNRYFSLLNAFRKVFEIYANEAATLAQAAAVQQQRNGRRNQVAAALPLDDDEHIAKNSVKVRKLVVTPTRMMLLAPEVIVSNRILRRFGEEYALRVVVRDEDGQKLQGSRMKNDILRAWLDELMRQPFKIGEREYEFLGWSNSQLRDHAFYMYAKTPDGYDVQAIRKWMGDFTAIQNVPKLMSRMGQCFTQAQTTLELSWNSGVVTEEDDILGGAPEPGGELYNFSDGIGRISMKYAERVCQQLEVTPVRSAYQIRYAGFKGMLSVDKELDKNPSGSQVVLRKSMHKFESDKSQTLEIVKYSQPSPVYLNRPFVMILDQVSEKSLRSRRPYRPASAVPDAILLSENVHRRVCNRIHELLDDELFTMADMLLEEKVSVTALSTRKTLNIDFKRLKEAGVNMTIEPFFRGLLLAIHQYTIKQQLWKQKIEVPLDLGRTMYGVLDTTRLLQYGTVFVQYSKDLNKPGENLVVLEGDIMVTKNPCIVPGDVRILRAVNIPHLAHMFDVIVFPQNGPRPHTDEMAGSDLDGDEYSVYWDPNMMLDPKQVQKPFHFPKNKPSDVEGGVQDDHMIEFFRRYLQQDSIGQVSNAHLAISDKEGIFSDKAMHIAVKCSMAVDFSKTGVPAEPLQEDERPTYWPDYFDKNHRPMYRSHRMVGKLFRRVKNASDIIRLGQDSISRPSDDRSFFDPHMEVRGWEAYKENAIVQRDHYIQYLQMLLDTYGVSDEASLISGYMVTIRNRLSDGEKEDFSFWNTEKIIELRVNKITQRFRHRFFEEFGGESEELLERPDEKMQQKASAWYMVTYADLRTMRGRVMLSFPWMVWEILRYVKLKRTFESYSRHMQERVVDPTAEILTRTIEEYCTTSQEGVARLISFITIAESNDPEEDVVTFYLKAYDPDFMHLLAVVLHWAEKEMGFEKEYALKPIYLARLLVDFCLQRQYLERRSVIVEQPPNGPRRMISKGVIVLEFLKYLASFKHRETMASKICNDEATIHLRRRQLVYVGQVAFKTYHHVAWTNRFDSLRLQNESRMARATLTFDDDEMEALTVVIEPRVTCRLGVEEVEKRLKLWSGVRDVRIRSKGGRDASECFVLAAGKLEARQALHDILLSENLQECLVDHKNPLLDQEVGV